MHVYFTHVSSTCVPDKGLTCIYPLHMFYQHVSFTKIYHTRVPYTRFINTCPLQMFNIHVSYTHVSLTRFPYTCVPYKSLTCTCPLQRFKRARYTSTRVCHPQIAYASSECRFSYINPNLLRLSLFFEIVFSI